MCILTSMLLFDLTGGEVLFIIKTNTVAYLLNGHQIMWNLSGLWCVLIMFNLFDKQSPSFLAFISCEMCVRSTTSAGQSCRCLAFPSPFRSRRWKRLRGTVLCTVGAWRELLSTVPWAERSRYWESIIVFKLFHLKIRYRDIRDIRTSVVCHKC